MKIEFCSLITLAVFYYVYGGIGSSCDKTRYILADSWGVLSDGPPGVNYTQDSHCEWLIKANKSNQFITLRFQFFGTECSYDYLFVYDGYSFESPLLGSFSGKSQPQEVTAISGQMLILLYSDTNYVLDGFHAEYSISDCLNNCSSNGDCVGENCICDEGWGGVDCSIELCFQQCGAPSRGVCINGLCHCKRGFSGQSCSLKASDPQGNKWVWVYRGGVQARTSHTAVYINETESLFVFGGYDLNSVLGDLVYFNFTSSRWMDEEGNVVSNIASPSNQLDTHILKAVLDKVGFMPEEKHGLKSKTFLKQVFLSLSSNDSFKTGSSVLNISRPVRSFVYDDLSFVKPSPRHSHAACRYGKKGFVIFGGKTFEGSFSKELWYFNGVRWSLRGLKSDPSLSPPGLAWHTLTTTDDGWLYIIGGLTYEAQFSHKIYRIQLDVYGGWEKWELVKPRGGKAFDVRVLGHTTIFSSGRFYIYGGITATLARLSKLSDRMFSFDLKSLSWSEIHYPKGQMRDSFIPRERAFHTATPIDNYIVVFGGYIHRHNKDEVCYDNQMYLYHLGCHRWVSHDILGPLDTDSQYPKRQGVFGHSASLRNNNTIIFFGGYHGNVNADLLAYVLPSSLATMGSDPEQLCTRHHGLSECTADPECGWCSVDEVCYGRTLGANCTTNLQTTRCPGICPSLTDCHSCLLHGKALAGYRTTLSVAHKLNLHQCSWCVHNARCHIKHDSFGVCGEDTPSRLPGWWGEKGTEVIYPHLCRTNDKRPGLTFIKYKHPANLSQPDSVRVVNSTVVELYNGGGLTRIEQTLGGFLTGRLCGFIKLPLTWELVSGNLAICVSYSMASLMLGSPSNLVNPQIQFKDLSLKLKSLRTTYSRELSKVKESMKSGAGTDEVYTPNLGYFPKLSFLGKYVTPRKSISNLDVPNIDLSLISLFPLFLVYL